MTDHHRGPRYSVCGRPGCAFGAADPEYVARHRRDAGHELEEPRSFPADPSEAGRIAEIRLAHLDEAPDPDHTDQPIESSEGDAS